MSQPPRQPQPLARDWPQQRLSPSAATSPSLGADACRALPRRRRSEPFVCSNSLDAAQQPRHRSHFMDWGGGGGGEVGGVGGSRSLKDTRLTSIRAFQKRGTAGQPTLPPADRGRSLPLSSPTVCPWFVNTVLRKQERPGKFQTCL